MKTRGQTIYVATNEAAHNDPSHLDLHCMQIQLHIFSFLLLLVLTLKGPSKVAADDSYFFTFYFSKKIRLNVSCESSAEQRIPMNYQVLFALKNDEKVFMNVVCCSRDWCFKV